MKRWSAIATVMGLAGVISFVTYALADKKTEPTTESAKTSRTAQSAPDIAKGLIVHEWGTFTSFSGSDGIRLEFRPLLDSDLPPFVLDRSRHSGNIFSKLNYRALVRMETPVTYFYTDEPITVRTKVRFPEGLLTEFYPPVKTLIPDYNPKREPVKDTALDWGQVQLIPPSYLNKATGTLAELLAGRSEEELLPQSSESALVVKEHYNYARETDSALVHVHRGDDPERPFSPTGDFFEKFLFYRGLGSFRLPLQVESLGSNQFQIANTGKEDLSWFMVLTVTGDELRFRTSDGVPAGEQRVVSLPDVSGGMSELEDELQTALIQAGLYEKEAKAMIKTWRSSWFTEEGARVLYLVPQSLTDQMLPLEIDPRPESTVRVLVGRYDVMTKEAEAAALAMVERSAAARDLVRQRAEEQKIDTVYPLPDEIQKLGRFAEPALARIHAVAKDRQTQVEAARLLDDLNTAQIQPFGL